MNVKIKKLVPEAVIPQYAHYGDAGMDLWAVLDEPIVLRTLERALVPTGIAIELPHGYEAQIRPRSGLAIKHGISVCNTPGTIDENYRGEIKVILINLSNDPFTINPGERIAQMVIKKYEKANLVLAEELSDTDRGESGFGSTGVK